MEMLAADGDECAARVVFLTLNDVYALHANDDGVGGVAEMATLLAHTRRAIEADDPGATVVVTLNGDFLWRSELDRRDKGALMVQVLNALGIEFVVLGNHEFDFGAPTLQELLSSARFQCLGSNIRSTATGDLLGGVVDTAIIEVQHGLRLGLFGVCTTETEEDALAGDTVRFEDEVLHARRCVELLQREGADVVVALTHLPMQRDKQLARQVPGISLVLGGHDHDVMTDVVGHTMIHKSGQDARWLGRVELTIHKRLEEDNTTQLARPPSVYFAWEMLLNRGFHPHAECLALVKEYERMVDADDEAQGKLEPLAVATAALDGTRYTSRRRDCDVGFLITDAMRAELQADVALIHAGLIKGNRLYAPGCVITPRWLERVLPHPRRTAVVSMSADCLRLALERMLRRYPSLSSSTPHVSGIYVACERRSSTASPVVTAMHLVGRDDQLSEALSSDQLIRVALPVSPSMAEWNEYFATPFDQNTTTHGSIVRDVVAQWLRRSSRDNGRIINIEWPRDERRILVRETHLDS
ncbi:hypothetical protein P43SY_003450 [Pythium insidiosum]|uniref:Calcineurin-like phosphoesterase n=1 Tax=Pythium insidiosum TaxID=114742 RepID=A0AAD5Q8E8_PYTIN|nr:hypothetical protein P43SY_003450 [Pythium insidiosum]